MTTITIQILKTNGHSALASWPTRRSTSLAVNSTGSSLLALPSGGHATAAAKRELSLAPVHCSGRAPELLAAPLDCKAKRPGAIGEPGHPGVRDRMRELSRTEPH